jgi:ABC-type glycerol-3-phosphate transport system substrate-binding protein
MRGSTLIKSVVAVSTAALLTSACLSSGSSGGGDSGKASGSVKGATVKIWTSVDQPILDGMKAVIDPEAKAQGFTIQWSKVTNINQLIITKIQANDVPDIAMIPQPGVVADIVKRGKATALDGVLDMNALKASMVPGTLDSGTVNGKLYGLLVSANAKSFVFYPKKAFEAAGYKAPTSIDELNALTDQIRSQGKTPWCLGIGSDTATGWPATDWFEDLILRYGGTQAYDDWVSHKVKFDSPVVRQAAAEFQKIAFTSGNVLGGRKSIASNAFQTAGNPMFNKTPGCWMYKQGSFITAFFPKAVQADMDNQVGVFYFPSANGTDKPMLGGGDLAMLLKNTAAGAAAMKLLAQTNLGDVAVTNGSSFLSPHKDFDPSKYKGAIPQQVAKFVTESTAFRFDGSDAMPGAVGAGTFWKDMTSWISGQESLDAALKNIDESWPPS